MIHRSGAGNACSHLKVLQEIVNLAGAGHKDGSVGPVAGSLHSQNVVKLPVIRHFEFLHELGANCRLVSQRQWLNHRPLHL